MKRLLIIFFFILLALLTSSCIINKHYYEYYETYLPDINEYENISKDEFEEYFFDNIYFSLVSHSSRYYSEKIRESGPFKLRLYCITTKSIYKKVIIEEMEIESSLGNQYSSETQIGRQHSFQYYYTNKENIKYYNTISDWSKPNVFNFDHKNGEVLTVKFRVAIYDYDNNIYYKNLKFILYPKTKIGYLELITDLF